MVTISDKQKILIVILFAVIFLAASFVWWYRTADDEPIVVHSQQMSDGGNRVDENIPNDDREIVGALSVPKQVVVHVKGAVENPGVYVLDEGKRVVDAVQIAGGALPEADLDIINLAAVLRDAEEVIVYRSVEEQREWQQQAQVPQGAGAQQQKININTATKEQLQTLSGIGPSKADAIIKHREQYGAFPSVEALLNVNGIGQKTLDNFKEEIVAE